MTAQPLVDVLLLLDRFGANPPTTEKYLEDLVGTGETRAEIDSGCTRQSAPH